MVEGHSVHRICVAHNRLLAGKKFKATSPNGRFAEGAKAINGKVCTKFEAIGKNLFAFFGKHVVHVHFGMSGRWSVHDKDDAPDPTDTTRLRLENDTLVTHLSAMTVKYGTHELFKNKQEKLGTDPLREDSNPQNLWEKVKISKRPIGLLLMDQGFFAGVGNIYRAEIGFKAGVHPMIKGQDLTRSQFDEIWKHSVLLLQRGYQTGSIITVDPDEAVSLGKPKLRRYIYNQSRCPRCEHPVKSWNLAGRTCYACITCQPSGTKEEDPERVDMQIQYESVRLFQSHCAREELKDRISQPEKLSVKELRNELEKRSMDTKGVKKVLIKRLLSALKSNDDDKRNLSLRKELSIRSIDNDGTYDVLVRKIERSNNESELPKYVKDIKAELLRRGLNDVGRKPTLIKRLITARKTFALENKRSENFGSVNSGTIGNTPKRKVFKSERNISPDLGKRKSITGFADIKTGSEAKTVSPIKPGTKHIPRIKTAWEAALEKVLAGEKLNVEHVAELDQRKAKSRKRSRR